MAKKKSWREKVNDVEEKIHTITPEWEERLGKGKILIPNALDIERIINKTKKGELLTNNTIRETLAKEKGVQVTAAIPTGVYLKYVALAAEEERETKKVIVPYWRVLKPDGSINVKFPGGAEFQSKLLEIEGHRIEQGIGKKPPKVMNYQFQLKRDIDK
ncbi:MGMT family protein [uncultured Psychroserpens sp.]|uniref:MGMT family protein n=1 Tax=uncultured Psychroserpens sp. TaxID=255436 RepID=UPI00260E2028|nr:MGMT family protein [uncultured Psychroserpens sp.]